MRVASGRIVTRRQGCWCWHFPSHVSPPRRIFFERPLIPIDVSFISGAERTLQMNHRFHVSALLGVIAESFDLSPSLFGFGPADFAISYSCTSISRIPIVWKVTPYCIGHLFRPNARSLRQFVTARRCRLDQKQTRNRRCGQAGDNSCETQGSLLAVRAESRRRAQAWPSNRTAKSRARPLSPPRRAIERGESAPPAGGERAQNITDS